MWFHIIIIAATALTTSVLVVVAADVGAAVIVGGGVHGGVYYTCRSHFRWAATRFLHVIFFCRHAGYATTIITFDATTNRAMKHLMVVSIVYLSNFVAVCVGGRKNFSSIMYFSR